MAVALLLGANTALAATATGNLSVTATVSNTCSVGTSSIDFGAYNPISGSAHSGSGSVKVTCTTGTSYSVELGAGTYSGSCGGSRCMKEGSTANYLPYELYKEVGHSNVWGGTAYATGTALAAQTGNGTEQTIAVYGNIASGQNVPAGSYSDTVTITINY